jgi:selenocysteine-specific elongation factor
MDAAIEEGWLTRTGEAVHLPDHSVRLGSQEQQAADRLLDAYASAPYNPPSEKEARAAVGPEVLSVLLGREDLVAVGGDVLFASDAYQELRSAVNRQLEKTGQVTVADIRDEFSTSRKYALALLEHLDRIRVTRREGDVHVRGSAS